MFFVSDRQDLKERKINAYLIREPMIAVLLAASNFEWTCGRCIMIFSKTPNRHLRKILVKTYGLENYKNVWKNEVIHYNSSFPPLAQIITNWENFKDAFDLRHRLIHGRGTCNRNMAKKPVEYMLSAVNDLYIFARKQGVDLHCRLHVRRKVKLPNSILVTTINERTV